MGSDTVSRDMLLENVFIPDDAEVLPPGLCGAMYNAFPHLFLSFSATFLGLMQAAYGGAIAYMTGPMSGAPIPHTEVATKGHAIADMLFAIESDRALYYRAISEGAKMMQLRAPASLARYGATSASQRSPRAARTSLRLVHRRLRDAPDLQEAKALLVELA